MSRRHIVASKTCSPAQCGHWTCYFVNLARGNGHLRSKGLFQISTIQQSINIDKISKISNPVSICLLDWQIVYVVKNPYMTTVQFRTYKVNNHGEMLMIDENPVSDFVYTSGPSISEISDCYDKHLMKIGDLVEDLRAMVLGTILDMMSPLYIKQYRAVVRAELQNIEK